MDVQFVAHRMDPEAGPVSGNGNARRAVHFDEGRPRTVAEITTYVANLAASRYVVSIWTEDYAAETVGPHPSKAEWLFDEINYAISYGMLDPAKVAESLKKKPDMVHVILTGRNAHPTIVELADTVTEMRQVKHAYEKGVMAQRGIEY